MKLDSKEFLNVPTISAHAAATIYFQGVRHTAWFGGSVEGACDCDIYVQEGDSIAYPLNVNFRQYPAWNPVFVNTGKQLFLFFKVGKFCDSWQTFYMEWTGRWDRQTMKCLPAGLNGPVKTPPVIMPKNEVFFGSSVETWHSWASYIEIFSLRKGEFKFNEWLGPIQLPQDSAGGGLIQPSLVKTGRDTIHGFFRSKYTNKIWYGTDDDCFKKLTAISDGPNSSVCAVSHNNQIYLACNPAIDSRLPLMVFKLEQDKHYEVTGMGEGLLIETEIDQEKFPREERIVMHPSGAFNRIIGTTEEASYPYMIVNPLGQLELVYTYGRRSIKRAVVVDL